MLHFVKSIFYYNSKLLEHSVSERKLIYMFTEKRCIIVANAVKAGPSCVCAHSRAQRCTTGALLDIHFHNIWRNSCENTIEVRERLTFLHRISFLSNSWLIFTVCRIESHSRSRMQNEIHIKNFYSHDFSQCFANTLTIE